MRFGVLLLLACVLGLALAEAHAKHKRKHHHGKNHGKNHHVHHHHGKHHHGKHHHKHHKSNDKAVANSTHVVVKGAKHEVAAEKEVSNIHKGTSHLKSGHADAVKASKVAASVVHAKTPVKEEIIVSKMKALEEKIAKKKGLKVGQILVNGPLPVDFKERFAVAVSAATKSDKTQVKVTSAKPSGNDGVMQVSFTASPHVVQTVEEEAADPDSKLANGNLHSFLVSKGDDEEEPKEVVAKGSKTVVKTENAEEATPVEEKGLDIDTAMPYGDLEPFGREDTAQELTEDSIQESNQMVDQLERAEVAEEKRAVFRALTRLRGAAITSFDGVARSQTGNIDEYNKIHKWRNTHPLHHLADEESDVSKWAFPDNADF
jgi:hypothetical protein